ncbi:DUF2795 domain-containing protein [Streptomyces sp. NPDC004012]
MPRRFCRRRSNGKSTVSAPGRNHPTDLQKALSGADHPWDAQQLTQVAQNNHAPKEITEQRVTLRATDA